MMTRQAAMLAFDNLCAELSEALPPGETMPVALTIDYLGGPLVLKSVLQSPALIPA